MAAAEAAKRGHPLRIMFQDEARFGRLPVMRAAWAPPGVRPAIQAAVERQFRYVYGAVSPVEGELDWMMTDAMNTENMSVFLAQLRQAHPDDYVLMVLDGASSHFAGALRVPEGFHLVPLPPYSPELNPTEMLWDIVRKHACANHYFPDLDAVIAAVDHQLRRLTSCAARLASRFCWPYIIQAI